jgi:hypothetical protein
MGIRREPTYLSYEVYGALRLLAKSRRTETDLITADQLADEMLLAAITQQYPALLEHQRQVAKLERGLLKTLGGEAI